MTTLFSPSTQIPAAAFPKSLCSLWKAMSQDPAWHPAEAPNLKDKKKKKKGEETTCAIQKQH